MTTLEKIDKLIEVYENPKVYWIETMYGLCLAWRILFNEHVPEYILAQIRALSRSHTEYQPISYFFPRGAIAPRLEILKQYRKQLTDK